MTLPETTTRRTDPETVPQTRGDDPLDIGNIPDFLRRPPQPATKPLPSKGD